MPAYFKVSMPRTSPCALRPYFSSTPCATPPPPTTLLRFVPKKGTKEEQVPTDDVVATFCIFAHRQAARPFVGAATSCTIVMPCLVDTANTPLSP